MKRFSLSLFTSLLVFFAQFSINTHSATDFFNTTTTTEQTFLPVDKAFSADLFITNDSIQVMWQAKPTYYMYQHGFKIEWINDGNVHQADLASTALDNPVEMEDPYFGKVNVYYHSVNLPTNITLTDSPILIKASSQGCADAGLCYPPYSQYFEIQPDGTYQIIDKASYQSALNGAGTTTKTDTNKTAKQATFAALIVILLSAFLGGLILNLMPCVLPILGLKAFQLAHQKEGTAKAEGLAYLAGVVLSFVAVALVMIGLRAAGNEIGWGFQLQNPWFIAALVYLFFLLGLSLSGYIQLGSGFMGLGQNLSEKGGPLGSFLTGVLAVIVASPCTAPFMGSALGFATTQPTVIALLIFVFLGAGMALPLTLICFLPQAGKFLPKPGAWMERLKEFFAFPLYLTAIWLFWILGKQAGIDAMILVAVGCVLLVLSFWLRQHFARIGKMLSLLVFLLTLSTLLMIPYLGNLGQQPEYIPYSKEKLAQLRAEGKPVFVDMTADWCITCKTNEATTLNTKKVQNAFNAHNVTYMKGDWTNEDPAITRYLNSYERNGVPLYVYYPAEIQGRGKVLPQLLTPTIVIQTLESAETEK